MLMRAEQGSQALASSWGTRRLDHVPAGRPGRPLPVFFPRWVPLWALTTFQWLNLALMNNVRHRTPILKALIAAHPGALKQKSLAGTRRQDARGYTYTLR